MLTFVVAGAGFTGIELAGELMERRDVLCARYHIDPKDVRIIVVEAMDRVLPIIEEPLRKKTEKYMRKHGIEIMLKSPIVAAEENLVILQSGESIKNGNLCLDLRYPRFRVYQPHPPGKGTYRQRRMLNRLRRRHPRNVRLPLRRG